MALSSIQFSALKSFLRDLPQSRLRNMDRVGYLNLDHKELVDLERVELQRLIAVLPKGGTNRVLHPILVGIRDKAKEALRLKRPAHFSGRWPKTYRFMSRINIARSGLRDGPMKQIYRLHPKAMAVDLTGTMTWNEQESGDLVIMGHRAEVTKLMTDAGAGLSLESRFQNVHADVNSEFDEQYGSMPNDDPTWASRKNEMPFYVSCQPGAAWAPTDAEGEVVLNPVLDVAQTVIGRAAGVGGAAAPTLEGAKGIAHASVGAAKDLTGIIAPQVMSRMEKSDDTLCTITVNVTPGDGKYEMTGLQTLDGNDLLRFTLMVMQR